MLMLIAFSVGNVWAVDYDLVYTLDGTLTNTGGNSNYAQAGDDVVQSDIHWSVTGNLTQNPWRIGGKNLDDVDREAYSKTAISDNIAKIEIEHGTKTLSAVNSMTVIVASNSDFSTVVSSFTPTFEASKTVTISRPDGKDWSNCYYKIVYNVDAGGSNSYLQLKSVKFYKEKSASDPVLESITITGDLDNKSYEEGQSIDFAGLTATGHYNNSSTADLTDDVEWSFSPALTAGLTSVTVTATLNEISGNKIINGLTVTEHEVTPGTYDIPTDNDLWGTSYSGQATSITTLSGSKNDVSITINKNTGSTMYVTSSQTRIYNGYTMIFSVPNGYAITALQFTADGSNWQGNHTADVGTMTDNKNWSGEANSVIITVAGTCRMQAVKVTYAVAAPSKAEAGLAYAEADFKKLAKLGDAFTAPTLQNPNSLTVSYASNNTDVAEVAANGAVTIKAAGVAVITASFDGNDDYKAGSASYTIGVTTHAGTEADPYVAADAKIAIDAMGTLENAYATGIVSNVVTKTLPQEGYITFYFSADGATTGQQIEAYKCYGLNSAAFEALSDVETGATVVVTGNLKKYNSTYEFDANCHLVSYEAPAVPKTHIANDQANPYTVAQAIAYAADAVTYDLDDYVYVQGVVYDVKSFNNGAMNIFIKDANAENQFELYKCAGINDGNATTPFEALTDVQAGNIVIGYGQLTVFNSMSELKQGNYLVDLQKPATGIELDATAEVEAGLTVNLTATILPSNATGTIVWSVESGDAYASVENGVVTGIAEGEAVIRATVQGTAFYAECTVTVTPEAAPVSYDYALVTDAAQLQDGLKVIIVAAEEDKAAGSAAATYRNVVDVERTTDGNYLILDSENMPTEFTLGVSGENFTLNDGNGYMYESTAKSVKVQDEAFEWTITIGEGNIATIQATNELRYNSTSPRFTTYASGQQALQLYVKNDGKQAAGLAWSANAVELTVGDAFEAPTLTNPNNLVVTITSDNEEVATVSEGIVSLVTDATGTAKITASYAGDETYRAASVSYTITVNAAEPTPASYDYALVTDAAQLQDGLKVIIVAAEEDKAAGSAAATYRNVVDVERTTDGNYLILDSENMPTEFTLGVSGENFTLNDGNGYMYESTAKSVKVQDEAFEWTITIGEGNIATIQATNELRYNSTSPRFTTYASGQQALQLYVKNDGKQAAGLAWSANAVELTVGDAFEAPTLTNPNNLVVTITSDNEDVATVSEGIVSLVADATGTAKITASYAGDETYRAASVSYTITVNPAPVPAETKNIVILAEYNSKFYAMTNSLSSGALAAVEVEKDGSNIVVSSAEDKAAIQWTATVEGENTTLMDANNKYIKGSNGASLSLDDAAYIWNWDGEKSCYISSEYTTRGLFFNNSGVFKGYATSNLTNDAYVATEVIEIDPENIVVTSKVDPQLAYTPAEVTLTVGGEFTPAVLGYAEGFDGLAAVTYASNNEDVATVNESGVVSLVADAIGTATITATFDGNNNYMAGSASYTITVNEAGDDLSGSWVLATAVPAVGQKVIIAATYQNETKAMGIQNSNNRAAVASTLEDDVLTPGAGTKVFTLVDAGDGKFAIQASNGNYLSAAGTGTSNYLKEAENFDEDNAKWTITIENGEANIVASSNNRNVLRYNSGNTIFSCYQSGAQRAINIYVQDTYTRALEPNSYYTVCLPKKMMEVRGASFWTLSSRNEAGSMAYLEEVDPTTAEAGTPFIIQATDTKLEVVYTGAATTTAGTNGALHGTLSDMDYDDLYAAGNVYLLIKNAIRPLASGNYLNANRAYIDYYALNPVTEAPQPAPGRRVRAVPMQQNTATGIDELNGSEAPAKVLINGQLFILRGEKMYDAKGQLVK